MILIVDDDPKFLEEARLRLDAGKGVFLAADAEQAKLLMGAVGSVFSVILVDLDMHGQNGFELIAELHRHFPGLSIIAVSGVYQQNVLESAKVMGAFDTLRKPIDDEWMPAILRARQKSTIH